MFTSASAAAAPDAPSDDLVLETARVVRSDRGLRINGYLVRSGEDVDRAFGCWYSLLSDPAGRLRRLTVRADSAIGERSFTLTNAPGSTWVLDRGDGQQTQPDFAPDTDVVLAGSLLTFALPARRLQLERSATGSDGSDESTTIEVAVIDIPELTFSTELVTYRAVGADPDGRQQVAVISGNGQSKVAIDDNGFVVPAVERASR